MSENKSSTTFFANPYVGPRPFQPGERIYGRDQEIFDLLDLLIAERIVLLYSPSGAGKTSLIQAGLLPELEEEGFRALPVMRVSLEPPADVCEKLGEYNRYVLSLLLSLEEDVPKEQQVPLPELAGMTFAEYLERRSSDIDHSAASPDGVSRSAQNAVRGPAATRKFVLIFDQFEEILTVNPTDNRAKVEFFTQVGIALRHRDYWALFSMREEFPARLDPYVRYVPTRFSNRFRLELLNVESAFAAVQEPVERSGVVFTPIATIKLVDDLRRVREQQPNGMIEELPGMYVEPVQLQVVCHRLWDHLPDDIAEIREADIRAAGDVDTALAGYYAERVHEIAEQTGVSERTIREWFLHHLITDLGIRGQLVKEPDETQGLANTAIEQLVDAHLVRAEQRRGVTWYELAHDRLIEPVQLDNFDWLQEHLSTLQREAALWELQERASGLLLLDDALKEVEQWAAEHGGELTGTEEEFLQACRAEQDRVRRERLKSGFIRGLAISATIVMCIAIFFYMNAETRRKEAERLSFVSLAQNLMNEAAQQKHDDLKLLLLRQAYLFNQKGRGKILSQLDHLLRNELGGPFFSRVRHVAAETMAVAISPDGQYLACGLNDGTIQIFDLHDSTAAPITLTGHSGPVCGLAFHPEGHFLASAGWDRTVRLWPPPFLDTTPTVLYGHSLAVFAVAFSPDGNRLASGSWDGTVRLWDVRNLQQSAQILHAHEAGVNAVAFSPDGTRLASGGSDRIIRLWNMTALDSPPEVLPFQQSERPSAPPHTATRTDMTPPPTRGGLRQPPPEQSPLQSIRIAEVNALAFSPDGSQLAAGTSGPNIWVWDVENLHQMPNVFKGHRERVLTLAFSPDGNTLASGSGDRDIRLWSVHDLQARPDVLRGHDKMVLAVAFSPDGQLLISGSDDETVRVWDVHASAGSSVELFMPTTENTSNERDGFPLQQASPPNSETIEAFMFSRDAQTLYAVNNNGDTMMWNTADPQSLKSFPGNLRRKTTAFALSPDSKQVAVGDDSGSVSVSSIDQSSLFPQEFMGHAGSVDALAFHPDGTLLASGGEDRTIRIRDLRNSQQAEQVLRGHEGAISALAFNPARQILASGATDTTIRLWNLQFPNYPPLLLTGHRDALLSLAFMPNGEQLASASEDGEVRLWQVQNLRTDFGWLLQSSSNSRLISKEENVLSLIFSPDGTTLAVRKKEAIHLWNIENLEANPVILNDSNAPPQSGTSSQADLNQPSQNPMEQTSENDLPGQQSLPSAALGFSPDGTILASGSQNHKVVLWTHTGAIFDEVCQRVWRNLSMGEWQQFVGNNMTYERTCPDLP